MFLTCPNCTTIFRVDADLLKQDVQSVRCSICQHIWNVSSASPSASQLVTALSVACVRLKHLWKPCLAALLVASLASGVITNRTIVTAYLPFLIKGFDRVGLSIRPALAHLQVTELNASYVGDTVRLSGGLRNQGIWRTHAADLKVTVRGVDGTIMQETVIRPDDDVIDSNAESGFFVQLAVDVGHEAQVTVTPLANRIYR